jgi:RNA-directed DNA polymerase
METAPKYGNWKGPRVLDNPQATASCPPKVRAGGPPGVSSQDRVGHNEVTATRETHKTASATTHPPASLTCKVEDIDLWGSEVPIVAAKSGNADGAKGHRFKPDAARRQVPDAEPDKDLNTDLQRLTQKAKGNLKERFTSLMGMLFRPAGLYESLERLAANKAPGVDGIRKADYVKEASPRINDLSARLRRLGYRPKPCRRVYIPKANGGRRPLGIPSFEDRIVQDRLSRILQAIWEPEFRNCSYGFRPGRSAHDALQRLGEIVTQERTQWVVEADIKGFFNHVSHQHLLRFLRHRIGDERMIRILRRFLKAGVMADGVFSATEEGTPQGGLVSPVLANIYLHYVLDWWFEGRVTKACRGKAYLIRYADDFVACFQEEADARQFVRELAERLAAFGLETEPTKTAILKFGTDSWIQSRRPAGPRPETFSLLGFTHYVTTSRTGKFLVGRKTEGSRMRKKLKELNQRVRELRTSGGAKMVQYVHRHLNGHFGYYGVSGNSRSIGEYSYCAMKILFKWLNRRSQKRSLTWERYRTLLKEGLLPKPCIVRHLYPKSMYPS